MDFNKHLEPIIGRKLSDDVYLKIGAKRLPAFFMRIIENNVRLHIDLFNREITKPRFMLLGL